MTSEGSLHSNVRSLKIPNLSYEDDVRVLTKDGAQRPGKGQSAFGLHLDLVDPLHLVFNRVLYSRRVHPIRRDLAQAGVEGGRLARPGRPGHEHEPVRSPEGLAEVREGPPLVPERVEPMGHCIRVEDPHNSLLSTDDGQDGESEINGAALVADTELAVLRPEALRDVELGKDLQSADK